MTGFFDRGWAVFPVETSVLEWCHAARRGADLALKDAELAHLYQCENTWFVGLDALQNDAEGRVCGSAALAGAAVDYATAHCGGWPALHQAQISGVFPGYPKPRTGETEAAFGYRLRRDAAHVDGVIGEGTPRRRFVKEPHAFILGLPLTRADEGAAPLVVWEGSHHVMRKALQEAFDGRRTEVLSDVDVTEIYTATRRRIFETCPRVVVHGPPGSVFLLHRLVLHGVAPWQETAQADPAGRLIAYFRPEMPGGVAAWLAAP